MSKGNIIQGQASGKLGDTVLMVRNGMQLARVYTKAGARPGKNASEAARIQRVKFGSASNQWGLYRFVCTRMFRKGRKTNQSDYNYFVKRNQHLLPYLSKLENADGVHVLMPGLFSEGNLGRIELVHDLRQSPSSETFALRLADLNSFFSSSVLWSGKVSAAKDALKVLYPYARKVTYLFSVPSEITVEEEEVNFVSQFVSHHTVVFDLYNESTYGENDLTISAFFSSQVSDDALKAIFNAHSSENFIKSSSVFYLYNKEGVDLSLVGRLGVLVFATDDNASDCYTTILQDSSVPSSYGPYALWAGYRTENSLRVAADSYGYQSGVMRDEIASYGNELEKLMNAYAQKLRSIGSETASEVERFIKSGAVQARTVRKATASSESEE